MNFGYVRPCECAERTIELLNGSQVFDMTVDSLWIDAAGVPGGQPQFFSWTSKFSPTGTVPYTIPPQARDTVTIRFCPDTPADSTSTQVEAMMHVAASGSGWSKELETFLVGKRALTFTPWPRIIQFPSGVIDVLRSGSTLRRHHDPRLQCESIARHGRDRFDHLHTGRTCVFCAPTSGVPGDGDSGTDTSRRGPTTSSRSSGLCCENGDSLQPAMSGPGYDRVGIGIWFRSAARVDVLVRSAAG